MQALELTAELLDLTAAVSRAVASDDIDIALAQLDRREPLLRALAEIPPDSLCEEARSRLNCLRALDAELLTRLQPALADLGATLARLHACQPAPAAPVARCLDRIA